MLVKTKGKLKKINFGQFQAILGQWTSLMKMILCLFSLNTLFSLTWIKIIKSSLTIPGFPTLFVKMAYFPGFPGSV